ncbi:hypothetical protein CMZ82_00615 [Lysobacteraceae bacterium NML93-0792]|nr:hypothetical protein CMZ82_00615 [Xanthomonadaceae bacterium NML93-0792]PBS16579.1 hypothetical protein CMZ81_04865 [Xanthomonadaceae bacterium NML93-0793]PBS19955.1 hypothetical protein CMZ80_02920 [Xanthomonadaceae bacterium NML93-0831]
MGGAKRLWMEEEERRWGTIDKCVCEACLDTPDLWRMLTAKIRNGVCDYCELEGLPVLPVHEVQVQLYKAIFTYYADPQHAGTPWVDGQWGVKQIDIEDVLAELDFLPVDELAEDIASADRTQLWIKAAHGHWAGVQDDELMLYSWSTFVRTVKHQTRFHFQRIVPERLEDEIPVSEMLRVVAENLANLLTTVAVGTRIYRARHLSQDELARIDASLMGPPPKEHAGAGRMNPAGIPYFYSAFDPRTAVVEIGDPSEDNKALAAAAFQVDRILNVVDLSKLPAVPPALAIDRRRERVTAKFLRKFVESITQKVQKDGREHVDYVPSQVVCEYMAQAYVMPNGQTIDGIIYPSAVSPDGINLVIFPSGRWFEQDKFPDITYLGPA